MFLFPFPSKQSDAIGKIIFETCWKIGTLLHTINIIFIDIVAASGQFDNPTCDGSDEKQSKRKDKPPAYLSGAPPYQEEPIKVGPVDYVEPASPEEDEDDPVKMKQKLAARYSKA